MLTLMISLALATATAEPAAQNPTPTTATAKPKKICRAEESVGSRLSRKTCKTQAEWDDQKLSDEATRASKRNGGAGN